MSQRIGVFIGFFLVFGLTTLGYANPFVVLKKAKSNPKNLKLLFEHGESQVWRAKKAKDKEFTHLYYVNLDNQKHTQSDLESFGEVLHLEKSRFAILKMNDTAKVAALSGELHGAGMACGVLFELKGDEMIAPSKADPQPIIDVTQRQAIVDEAISIANKDNIAASVENLSSMRTRYYNSVEGQGVADRMIGLYQPYAGSRSDVVLEKYIHSGNLRQPSLMVRIIGQERPDEIVVLGSHIDSINGWGGEAATAPGADDNASGTATNLEIFRVLMEKNIRLKRTLEIHGYAAEEIGLVGSQDIANRYFAADKKVIAMVQHDMNLFSGDDADKIWFVSNNTNAALNRQLESLLKLYLQVPFGYAHLSGGNSDHYSWTRKGYPAAFPFENPIHYNNEIHTTGDTIANSGRFTQALEFAKLGLAYVVHFAGIQ